jgi:hypothetical protein
MAWMAELATATASAPRARALAKSGAWRRPPVMTRLTSRRPSRSRCARARASAGMVGTEMLYHLVGSRELDGGAMVTASHNPKAYTGVKLVRHGAIALSGTKPKTSPINSRARTP